MTSENKKLLIELETSLKAIGFYVKTALKIVAEIKSNSEKQIMLDEISDNAVIEEVKRTLGQTPPELAADIVERGIVMTGGGSLLKGLDKLLAKETGVPVILAENALYCVALGAGMYWEQAKGASSSRNIYNNINS